MTLTADRRLTPSPSPAVAMSVPFQSTTASLDLFLADASEALAERVDLESVIRAAVQLPVPQLAHICVLDLVVTDDGTRRVVTQHADPSLDQAQRAFADEHLPPPPAVRSPVSAVLASGDTLMHTVFARRSEDAMNEPREMASIIVGLLDGSEIIGVLSFLAHHSARQFDPVERRTFEGYARRVTRAVRHARRFQADRDGRMRAEAELEVLRHTTQVLTQCTEQLRQELEEGRRKAEVAASLAREGATAG